jgi:hypothetical protein
VSSLSLASPILHRQVSVHGQMVPDSNKAHWVDMGVDVRFEILVR